MTKPQVWAGQSSVADPSPGSGAFTRLIEALNVEGYGYVWMKKSRRRSRTNAAHGLIATTQSGDWLEKPPNAKSR